MRPGKLAAALTAALVALPIAFAQGTADTARSGSGAPAPHDRDPASPTGVGRERAAGVDARHCLEFPTNVQVIACAEKYRPDRRRA